MLSAYAQFAPYTLRDGDWDSSRDAFGDAVVNTLAQYAPDIRSLIVAAETLTPLDLERGWGLTGGHIFHGELSLDQFFTMRPLLGLWSVSDAVTRAVPVRLRLRIPAPGSPAARA